MEINVSADQIDYMIELVTLDLALSMITRGKLKTPYLRDRLDARIDANRNFLNMLKEKRHEASPKIPATRY